MLSAIATISSNFVIGQDDHLLWHLSNDVKRLKELTKGHAVIMGRKTFDALSSLLPGCHHIILTRDMDYQYDHLDVSIIHSISELFPFIENEETGFVMGGGEIYQLLLPLCDTLYLTNIHKSFKGNIHFPVLSPDDWELIDRTEGVMDTHNPYPHIFMTYQRKQQG